jgi:hypothetical protein
MVYVLVVLSGVYSVGSTATISSYSSDRSCREAGESYVKQAPEAAARVEANGSLGICLI